MTKKLLLPILLVLTAFIQPLLAQDQNKPFSISGEINGATDKQLRLEVRAGNCEDGDLLSEIKNGKFHFEGTVDGPQEFRLYLAKPEQTIFYQEDFIVLYVEPGAAIKIRLNVANVSASKVEGPETDKEYRKLLIDRDTHTFGPTHKRIVTEWEKAEAKKDALKLAKLLAEYRQMNEEIRQWNIAYIKQHPKSYVSAYQLYAMQQNKELQPAEVNELLSKLDPSLYTAMIVIKLKDQVKN